MAENKQYYHVCIEAKIRDKLTRDFAFGFPKEELMNQIINPFNNRKPILFVGKVILPSQIKQINIFESAEGLAAKIELPNGKNALDESDNSYTRNCFLQGRVKDVFDVTNSLLVPVVGGQIRVSKSVADVLPKNKIFIVHGRYREPALDLKDYLKDTYHLDVVIFDDVKKKKTSPTIIELLEDITNNAAYAFVVATPDDLGAYCKEIGKCKEQLLENPETINVKSIQTILSKFRPRARQNVVFEHGLFLGALGRDRVCCLLQVGTEDTQSDISGIMRVDFRESISETFAEIVEKLKDSKIRLIKP